MNQRITVNGRPTRRAEQTIDLGLAVLTAKDSESKRLRTRLDQSGGLPLYVIAAACGCSEARISQIVAGALAKARRQMERRGVTAADVAAASSRSEAPRASRTEAV